jgi:hypothetical protein
MTTRYDILTTREGNNGKKYYTKVGTMFPLDKGGFALTFDALPIPSLRDGKLEVRAVAWEPKPKDGQKPDLGGDEVPW